jgi:hypothetical protein
MKRASPSSQAMTTIDACRTRVAATVLATALLAVAAVLPASVSAQSGEPWRFQASLFGWFPDLAGRTRFAEAAGRGDFEVGIGDILENLEFTFQGNVDARKGRFGVLADVVYMSIGKTTANTRGGSIGGIQIPVDAATGTEFDMKSWIWTVAGYYRAIEGRGLSVDVFGGVRYTDIAQTLDWTVSGNLGAIPAPGRSGRGASSVTHWDAIIGARGRSPLTADDTWFLPWYIDIGTGESDFTWQAMAGVGYAFKWGEAVAGWRYLAYDMPNGSRLADIDFSGPMVGASFRW